MIPYDLTPAAEADLREIARYTRRQWGAAQSRRYAQLLAACF
jgi:plasmid stabilization system protein ParE